jgi:hypothetical protein
LDASKTQSQEYQDWRLDDVHSIRVVGKSFEETTLVILFSPNQTTKAIEIAMVKSCSHKRKLLSASARAN